MTVFDVAVSPRLIVQAFSMKLTDVLAAIPQWQQLGVTHIQISPIQRHCTHGSNEWYKLYQPVGTNGCIGNSLGTAQQLRQVAECAHRHGLKVVMDVVLNHRTGCIICLPVDSIQWLWEKYISKKNSERFRMIDWGPKTDMDAALKEHLSFLKDLLWLGVDGFRFDAAKHIPPQYLHRLVQSCMDEGQPVDIAYGEVLDACVDVSHEYTRDTLLHVTNFPLTCATLSAFRYDGNIRSLIHAAAVDPARAVTFADCHDSIQGDSYAYPTKEDGILASCFLLARGQGVVLIPYIQLQDPRVKAGCSFFVGCNLSDYQPQESQSSSTVLIIARGRDGFAIINKGSDWAGADSLYLPSINNGLFKELQHNFHANVENSHVVDWGGGGPGYRVGPREALYFLRQ